MTRRQFYVRTKSYEWQWDVVEEETQTGLQKVGIIDLHDYQQRTLAVVKGEWKTKLSEPKVWRYAE